MRHSTSLFLTVIVAGMSWAAWIVPVVAQPSVQQADVSAPLEQRWQWAGEQFEQLDNAVVAWQFTTELDEKLHINAMAAFEHGIGWSRGISVSALSAGNRTVQDSFLRPHELVVLFRVRNGELQDVDLLASDDPVHWRHRLFWLGPADNNESYQLLAGLLDVGANRELNRGLINAIALHRVNERTAFLNSLFNTAQWADYRTVVLHALAQQQSSETETLLLEIAGDSTAVLPERRIATTALRTYDSPASMQLLLALTGPDQPAGLRREAIESLAWFPAEQVTDSLNQIAWFDENHRVRNEAVESLAKLHDGDANTLLLAIARQHPSLATREEAMQRLQRQLF